MKYRGYKKGILRAIAAILAVSMVFSNEMAVCSVVYASYGPDNTQTNNTQNLNEGSPAQAESPESIAYAVFSVSSMLPAVTVTLNNESITASQNPGGESGGGKDGGSNSSGGDENGGDDSKDNSGGGNESGTDDGKDNNGDGDESGGDDGKDNNGDENDTGDGKDNNGDEDKNGGETGTEDEEGAVGDEDDVENEKDVKNEKDADKEDEEKKIALAAEEAEEAVTEGVCGNQGNGDNLTWSYDADTETLTIRGTGAMKNYNNTSNPAPWLDLGVKHLVIEDGVTIIGQYAFYYCTELEGEIVLPTTLTTLEYCAFNGCSGITNVYFQDGGSPRKLTIANYAFSDCALKSIHFPAELTDMSQYYSAYSNCEIEEVNIPAGLGEHITYVFGFQYMSPQKIIVEEGVKQIDSNAISKSNLEEIYLPESITEISDSLFNGAAKLARINPTDEFDVNIPASVTRIGTQAFYNCYALEGEVHIPAGVTVIGKSAFSNYSSSATNKITKIVFAENEEESRALTFDTYVFNNCTSLQEIQFPNNLTKLSASSSDYNNCTSLTKLTIPGSLRDDNGEPHITQTMGFYGMTSVTNLTIEDGIKAVDTGAIYPNKLVEVYLSKDLTEIPDSFFSNATNLARINPTPECNVNIPENVTRIGNSAFYYCTALDGEVRIPAKVTEIGNSAFSQAYASGSSALKKITFEDGGEENRTLTIGTSAFQSCRTLQEIHFPNNLTKLTAPGDVYAGCTSLKTLTIPGSLRDDNGEPHLTKEMGFWSMQYVENLIIEDGIKEIDSADNYRENSLPRSNLVEVRMPETLEEIPPYLFRGASKLVKINPIEGGCQVNIPEGVKKIGTYAFQKCYALGAEVCLPVSLTDIGVSAFEEDSAITGITFADGGENRSLAFGTNAFKNCAKLEEIRFPDKLKSLSVPNNPYSDCTLLTRLTIPGSLRDSDGNPRITTEMGFQWMTNVTNLTIEEGITEIEGAQNVWSLPRTKLEEVYLPETLEEIPPYLFYDARNLARINPTPDCNVNIPEGVTLIGTYAFGSCYALAGEVCLPVSLTDIEERAFNGDSAITGITFAEGGENRSLTFGVCAFSGCTRLEEIRFPKNLTSLSANSGAQNYYANSYYGCSSLTRLTIPGSLRDADGEPHITPEMGFRGMQYVTNLTIEDGIETVDANAVLTNRVVEVYLSKDLLEIPDKFFQYASNLTKVNPDPEGAENGCNVNIPESVTRIGNYAFQSCSALAGEVRIPVSVTDIGDSAFNGDREITGIIFAEGGTNRSLAFGVSAFSGCTKLKEIHFPGNLTSLTAGFTLGGLPYSTPYYGCTSLTEVTIPRSLVHITPEMGFQWMTSVKKLTIEEGITEIDGNSNSTYNSLPRGSSLEEVWLPETLKEISPYLFSEARNLVRINPTDDSNINIPEGVEKIGQNAFSNCYALAGELHLPSTLTSIGNSAFYYCSKLTGDLRIPAGVTQIGQSAFHYCPGLGTELYLPDGYCSIGKDAFYGCSGLTSLHTGLVPCNPAGSSLPRDYYNNNLINTIWFHGLDDRGTAEADGVSVGWETFFNYSAFTSYYAPKKLYIADTVNHLTPTTYWSRFSDVTFVGENVVTLEKTGGSSIFPGTPAPLNELEGTYYVSKDGALYALNAAAGTAALAYCPPGVTSLYIPATITATADMVAKDDSSYARTYRVTGVAPHAVVAATDLESVTAVNPGQITLSTHAFADCPTLSRVNGVTTQKEANALFGPNGTPAIKKAFANTGMDENDVETAGRGNPMRSLTYTNPNVGKLTIDIRRTAGKPDYQDDAYRLLTGQGVAFDLRAEAYGTGELKAPFRVYFEPDALDFTGIKEGTQTITFESNGSYYDTEVKTVYDRITGCFLVSFNLPAGVTWEWKGVADTGSESVMYPVGTPGGGLCVWGEVLDFTDAGTDNEDDEVFGGFTGDVNYMMTVWGTERNLYELSIGNRNNKVSISSSTHKPYFSEQHYVANWPRAKFRNDEQINNNADGIGKDPVTAVGFHYTITLPEGMTWADAETILNNVYSYEKGEVISISEDRRTLVYEFTNSITDSRGNITGINLNSLHFGSSGSANRSIVIGEDYDFYHDLGQRIEYKCQATFYYTYSEPDVAQEVTGYENLIAADAGTVELSRKYAFDNDKGERGRGLPMEISFVAENKGKDPAYVALTKVTDEVVNDNGYLYLSAEQMADVILGESKYLEIEEIRITKAVLYQGLSYKSEVSHTATDGTSTVQENLLNTWTNPNPSGEVTLTLTVKWPEGTAEGDAVTGDGTAQGRRPIGLTVKVGSGAEQEIVFSDDNRTLAGNIRSALEQNGYVIPTGLYKITWNATDAARAHQVGAYTDTADKTYYWIIGSYHATVKPDYLQGHHYLKSDSQSAFRLFESSSSQPTAQAVFTLKNDSGTGTHDVTEGVRDTGYNTSMLKMNVTGIDSRTGEEILVQSNQSQWICPGVVLSYAIEYQNGNSIEFGDMPFMQTFDKNQCLLAPVNKNTDLADKGYDTITFMGSEYYMLKPAEEEQEIKGVWLGSADGDCFYADTVSIAGKAQDNQTQQSVGTQIRWYEKDIKAREDRDGSLKKYRFFSYVLAPEEGQERPSASSVIYANNYKSDSFSTRLYTSYGGSYRSESIGKSIIANPEAAGTDEEKVSELSTTYLGVGTSVTYRLSFDEYWIGDYTLKEGELYDLLPRTYGEFAWKLGDNVKVAYYLKERVARAGEKAVYEKYPLSGSLPADFAKIDTVNAPVRGMGENVEQYRLSFGDFTIPYNRTLYIYVTLTFPEKQDVWDGFADAVDGTLYNTVYYDNMLSSVAHMVAKPAQVFLKTGVYGTDGDPYGYIYANSDEATRIVKYYVVIYNHGKSNLFLNPVHIKIPKGFKLKPPPKYTGSVWPEPDWNLTDVSVLDAEPPANIGRHRILNVAVTYPEGKEDEAYLDIIPYYYYRWEVYDDLVGKYFLKPGEYVAMEVRFEIEGYQDTEDAAELPAAMEIADPYKVGRIAQVQGVDAHRSSYANSNEGTPEFWESDETAEARGFTVEEPTETGKWVASETKMRREEAKPGVTKGAPVRTKAGEGEIAYDPQEGVAMEHPVKWECGLMNGGTNSLTDYRVKDSVQWPYVFDGEVKFTSQISAANDQKFTITRYTSPDTLNGETVEETDRTRLQVNGEEVKIAKSREEALKEDSGCYAEVFYGARVYFYTEDVFGDGHPAETMEIDFTPDKKYGIGPAPAGTRLKSRTLSYWTKFDLSCKDKVSRSSYANRIVMEPQQPYTKADVSEGIAIDGNGEPVKNDGDEPAGIMALGYVSVNAGSSTAAWMKVKENKKAGEEDKEPDISGDIAALLTKENKILQGDTDNTVTYTLNVLNHAADAGTGDTVDSERDRRYSINNMVIINTLPHVGDKMPFNSKVPRNSDYAIIPADSDNFNLKLYYYDGDMSGGQDTDIDESKLRDIPEGCYQILYNESTTVVSSDWEFIENSAPGWNETVQDSLKMKGWKTEDEFVEVFGNLTYARSFRIELKEPNTDFDSLADKQDYRSLMKPGRTIVVKYQAKILTGATEDGTKTPTPGQCAWNSFGYRFDRFAGGSAMEASSIRTGVQIPSIPILYEKLIDYNQNPYYTKEPQTFTFKIDKVAREDEDGVHPAQWIRFSVTVGTGQSENNKDLRYISDAASEITWGRAPGDEYFFWEDGASYIVEQETAPEELPLFSVKVNNQLTNGFVYDALYEPVIVVTNQSKVWSSQLYKMDSRSKGYDPTLDKDKEHILFLPDALFGLYTTDELQRIDLSAITQEKDAERYEWKERYQSVLSGMLEVTYGDDPETAVRLYLKDFSVTDDDGEIIWSGLEDDRYYVRELDAPTGYKPDERFYQITRQYEVLSVYNDRGLKFPITGGTGVLPFYITGAMILSANAALWGERRKQREKKRKKRPAMTPAMMCKIIVRVIQIRRERRAANREKLRN